MLDWPRLRTSQRLVGIVLLLAVTGFGALIALYPGLAFGARVRTLAAPMLMLGVVLHPATLYGSRDVISWSRTPWPCRAAYCAAAACFGYGWVVTLLG